MKQSPKGENEVLKMEPAGYKFNSFVSPKRNFSFIWSWWFDDKQRGKGARQSSRTLDVIKLPQWKLWGFEAEDNGIRIRTEEEQLQPKIRRIVYLKKEKNNYSIFKGKFVVWEWNSKWVLLDNHIIRHNMIKHDSMQFTSVKARSIKKSTNLCEYRLTPWALMPAHYFMWNSRLKVV